MHTCVIYLAYKVMIIDTAFKTHPALTVRNRICELPADAKVADLAVPFRVQQQVGWLNVPMHHTQALVQMQEPRHHPKM